MPFTNIELLLIIHGLNCCPLFPHLGDGVITEDELLSYYRDFLKIDGSSLEQNVTEAFKMMTDVGLNMYLFLKNQFFLIGPHFDHRSIY